MFAPAVLAADARTREPAGGPPLPDEHADSGHALEAGTYGWYVCAACAARLAREDWALDARAQGPLVFANPHGKFFELLLVTHVVGAVFERGATIEFTWFSGYAWRIGTCVGCRTHIGWHFEATHDASLREFVALSRAAVRLLRSE
jgi:hypothetical protein